MSAPAANDHEGDAVLRKGPLGRLTARVGTIAPGPLFSLWLRVTSANVWLYRISRGRLAGSLDGAPIVLVHHIGRRSGEHRVAPLLCALDGPNVIVIGSWAGSPTHPAWFRNLLARPDTEIELRGERRPVHARVAEGEERERLWAHAVATWPAFADYQARTERVIPVVVLEPRGG